MGRQTMASVARLQWKPSMQEQLDRKFWLIAFELDGYLTAVEQVGYSSIVRSLSIRKLQ